MRLLGPCLTLDLILSSFRALESTNPSKGLLATQISDPLFGSSDPDHVATSVAFCESGCEQVSGEAIELRCGIDVFFGQELVDAVVAERPHIEEAPHRLSTTPAAELRETENARFPAGLVVDRHPSHYTSLLNALAFMIGRAYRVVVVKAASLAILTPVVRRDRGLCFVRSTGRSHAVATARTLTGLRATCQHFRSVADLHGLWMACG